MAELSELVKAAWPAAAILISTHAGVSLARSYIRFKATQGEYPNKSFLERLPRCIARRVFNEQTIAYTLLIGTIATGTYYITKYS